MSQVITDAFASYWQQCLVDETPVELDEFVLAYVPGLDPDAPIDPASGLPLPEQIVHRHPVDQRGRINNDAVAYSIVMDTTVGDFTFNAMYLINSAQNLVGMIVHKGDETKLKTDPANGQTGNSLVKSMLMEYDRAAEASETVIDASTWQIDYAARLRGMDEDLRRQALGTFGQAAFYGDGFKLVNASGLYKVQPGQGYVGGLLVELSSEQEVTPSAKPVGLWLDVYRAGTLLSPWVNHLTLTLSAADLVDYVDANGYPHFVTKLAVINADDSVTDTRARRTLTLTGDVTGEASFNGPDSIQLEVAIKDNSHAHTIENVEGLQEVLEGKADIGHSHTAEDVDALPLAGGTLSGDLRIQKVPAPAGLWFEVYNPTDPAGAVARLNFTVDGNRRWSWDMADDAAFGLTEYDVSGGYARSIVQISPSGSFAITDPVSKTVQGNATNSLVRKDYVDAAFVRKGDSITLNMETGAGGTLNTGDYFSNIHNWTLPYSNAVVGPITLNLFSVIERNYYLSADGSGTPVYEGFWSTGMLNQYAGTQGVTYCIVHTLPNGTEEMVFGFESGGQLNLPREPIYPSSAACKSYVDAQAAARLPVQTFSYISHPPFRVTYTNTTGLPMMVTCNTTGLGYDTNSLVDMSIELSGGTIPVNLSIKKDSSGEYDDLQKGSGACMVPPGSTFTVHAHDAILGYSTTYAYTAFSAADMSLYVDPTTFDADGVIRAFTSDEERDEWAPECSVEVPAIPDGWSHERHALMDGAWVIRPEWLTMVEVSEVEGHRARMMAKATAQAQHFDMMDELSQASAWRSYYRELHALAQASDWPLVTQWPTAPALAA